jgi:ribosomal protein S18 acetylase RimI-like enzyme
VSDPAAGVALRPARDDDYDFFARVYASTREEELAPVPFTAEQKAAFLAQQFAAQTKHYAEHYADASFAVILVDGERAGRLIVGRWEREIRIADIALLPPFRGAGVATRLLRSLIAESEADGKPLTIHVERENAAMRLYERLGFGPVEDRGVYLKMERPPGGVQEKTAS